MKREYTYAELCMMKKKRVIKIAGFSNIKDLVKQGFNREIDGFNPTTNTPIYKTINASKKYIARLIACDR